MASRILPGINLKAGWTTGEGGWGDEMNANLEALSTMTQLVALDVLDDAPGSLSNGDIYLTSDDFDGVGQNNKIMYRDNGSTKFITPKLGYEAYVVGTGSRWRFDGTEWVHLNVSIVPPFTAANVGDVLRVNAGGTAVEWGAEYDPDLGIPVFTGSYQGRVLTVAWNGVDDPTLIWAAPAHEVPTIQAADLGKRLVARGNEEYHLEEDTQMKNVSSGYTLTNADLSGGVVIMAAGNINIPTGLSRASTVTIIRATPIDVTITPASGVTLESANGRRKLRARWSSATLIRRSANSYIMVGDIAE